METPQLQPITQQIFPDRQSKINGGLCSGQNCSNVPNKKDFTSKQSIDVFKLTGLCIKCQNEIFDSLT
jgi:hypothetical protein